MTTQPQWIDGAASEAWEEAQRIIKDQKRASDLRVYQTNPVGFVENVLGEYITDDCKDIMQSVRDYPITLAKSSTGPGKSWTAARVSAWFYKVFDDAKVFLTAAPPEDNIKKILWGELMGVVHKHKDLFDTDNMYSRDIKRHDESFITIVTIPQSGTAEQRVAKFCADADDLFEMRDGSAVRYGDLIGKSVSVISVNSKFEKQEEIAEFFDNGVQIVYKLKFEDGSAVYRTQEHPLYTCWNITADPKKHKNISTHKRGRIRPQEEGWKKVGDIAPGDGVLCPLDTAFNFGKHTIDDNLVKFLGYMIGDGCFVDGKKNSLRYQFTQQHNAQLAEFISVLDNLNIKYNVYSNPKYSWTIVDFRDKAIVNFVKDCGLHNRGSATKFVPKIIFNLSKKQIALFLNRLFATDGWASLCVAGNYQKAEVGYVSKSKQLIDGIQRLLLRFGIYSRVTRKISKWTTNGEKRSGAEWCLCIWHARDLIRFVESIGIYGKEEQLGLCYAYSKDRKWTHANWKFEKPGYRWKKVKSVSIVGRRQTVGVSVPRNHTYLTSLVEHNSGKHSPHILFVVDEGDGVPDEVFTGIEGCMSGGMARLLVMFNPKMRSGHLYHMEQNGTANVITLSAFNHPNVITGKDVIPGAVNREITVRRVNEWTEPLREGEPPDSSCFVVPDFLVGSVARSTRGTAYPPLIGGMRKITVPNFSYMVLGQYPAQSEAQLINKAWIDAARTRWDLYVAKNGERPPVGVRPILGLDVAEMGVDYNITCLRYGGFVPKFKHLWNGLDTDLTARRALDIYRRENVYIAMIDATGVGSSVAPFMAREGRLDSDPVRSIGVKVASGPSPMIQTSIGEFYMLRDQLYWALMLWLRDDNTSMLPPDQYLIDELSAIQYEVNLRGKIRITDKEKLRNKLRRSPDRADALALTFAPYDRPKIIRLME